MPYRFSLLAIFLSLGLTACAGKPEHGKRAYNTFTTKIHSDGSKRFEFAMVDETKQREGGRDEGKRSGRKGDGGGRSGQEKGGRGQSGSNQQVSSIQSNRGDSSDDKRDAIIELLDGKIAESGYCRRGYIELRFSQMRDRTELVGECQESASDEDKQRWQ